MRRSTARFRWFRISVLAACLLAGATATPALADSGGGPFPLRSRSAITEPTLVIRGESRAVIPAATVQEPPFPGGRPSLSVVSLVVR